MPQEVEIEGVGVFEFPDGTSESVIQSTVKREVGKAQRISKLQSRYEKVKAAEEKPLAKLAERTIGLPGMAMRKMGIGAPKSSEILAKQMEQERRGLTFGQKVSEDLKSAVKDTAEVAPWLAGTPIAAGVLTGGKELVKGLMDDLPFAETAKKATREGVMAYTFGKGLEAAAPYAEKAVGKVAGKLGEYYEKSPGQVAKYTREVVKDLSDYYDEMKVKFTQKAARSQKVKTDWLSTETNKAAMARAEMAARKEAIATGTEESKTAIKDLYGELTGRVAKKEVRSALKQAKWETKRKVQLLEAQAKIKEAEGNFKAALQAHEAKNALLEAEQLAEVAQKETILGASMGTLLEHQNMEAARLERELADGVPLVKKALSRQYDKLFEATRETPVPGVILPVEGVSGAGNTLSDVVEVLTGQKVSSTESVVTGLEGVLSDLGVSQSAIRPLKEMVEMGNVVPTVPQAHKIKQLLQENQKKLMQRATSQEGAFAIQSAVNNTITRIDEAIASKLPDEKAFRSYSDLSNRWRKASDLEDLKNRVFGKPSLPGEPVGSKGQKVAKSVVDTKAYIDDFKSAANEPEGEVAIKEMLVRGEKSYQYTDELIRQLKSNNRGYQAKAIQKHLDRLLDIRGELGRVDQAMKELRGFKPQLPEFTGTDTEIQQAKQAAKELAQYWENFKSKVSVAGKKRGVYKENLKAIKETAENIQPPEIPQIELARKVTAAESRIAKRKDAIARAAAARGIKVKELENIPLEMSRLIDTLPEPTKGKMYHMLDTSRYLMSGAGLIPRKEGYLALSAFIMKNAVPEAANAANITLQALRRNAAKIPNAQSGRLLAGYVDYLFSEGGEEDGMRDETGQNAQGYEGTQGGQGY